MIGGANARGAASLVVFSVALVVDCSHGPTAGPPSAWHVVLTNLDPTLLCVWGTAPDDVFTVGGSLGDGGPSVILHYDGARWTDLAPGGTATFWWANGTGPTDVWAVGERGRITHWDGAKFTEHTSGTTATLFGVWAAARDDVWAVGGTPGSPSGTNDVVLHFDGTGWSPETLPKKLGLAFFKVWGASPQDLYVVGEAGTIWHRGAGQWTLDSNPPIAQGTLLTVNGCGPNEIYAVGGRDVLDWDGTKWARMPISDSLENDVNGVSCGAPGRVVIVGGGGLKERLSAGQWQDDFMQDPHTDLHGAWADPAGGYWAAGGDFVTGPIDGGRRAGLLAYFGPAPPSSTLAR